VCRWDRVGRCPDWLSIDVLIVASNAHVHEAVDGMEEVAELISMTLRHTPSQLVFVLNRYKLLVITLLAHVPYPLSGMTLSKSSIGLGKWHNVQ
jgi:hypothetical protein